MSRILVILTILTMFGGMVFGQGADLQNNWCRAGLFAEFEGQFKAGSVLSRRNERVNFRDDDRPECPGASDCRKKSYLTNGDPLVIGRQINGFACGWFTSRAGKVTVGWLPIAKLKIIRTNLNPSLRLWLGDWVQEEDSISFTENKLAGFLNVTGDAYWQGIGDNVHIGELDSREEPAGNVILYNNADQSEYACKAKMQLLGEYLVVKDNQRCGGANVTFSGVYRKRR